MRSSAQRLAKPAALLRPFAGVRRGLGVWAVVLWLVLAALSGRAWASAAMIAAPVAVAEPAAGQVAPPCHGAPAELASADSGEADAASCECCQMCSVAHPAPEADGASLAASAGGGGAEPLQTSIQALPDGLFRPPRP